MELVKMNKKIVFENKNIFYSVSGTGDAVVLLHGFMESKAIWAYFTEKLKENFSVIAIDLPGHGESEVVSDIHSMELMAKVVHSILEEEDIAEVVFVGHSMGGYVALQLAEMFKEQAKGVVLFHSHAAPDSAEAKKNRDRTIKIVNENKGSFITSFIPDLFAPENIAIFEKEIKAHQEVALKMDVKGITAALAGMRDRKGSIDFLPHAQLPVLFISGKQDPRMPTKQLMEQALIPSHSEMLILENVGHMGFLEAKNVTVSAVIGFSKRCFLRSRFI